MFKILIFSALIFCFINQQNFTQENSKDTLNKTFQEINIFGEKINKNKSLEYLPNQTIKKNDIDLINKTQLSDIIQLLSNTFIKDYGGTSGIKSISLRGGNSSQTLIMLDNIKINSAQNGSFDLSNLHSDVFDKIEIFKGGASAILGSNSLSGAINLSQNLSINQKQNILKFSFGSYDEYNISIKNNINLQKTDLKLVASLLKSKNNFEFTINNFGKEEIFRRENADFWGINLALFSKTNFKSSLLSSNAIYYYSYRGTPGAVLQGYVKPSKANLTNEGLLTSFNYIFYIFDSLALNISSYFKISKDKFYDPDAPLYQNNLITYNAFDYSFNTNYTFTLEKISNTINLNYEFNKLNSNGLFKNFGDEATRHNISFSSTTNYIHYFNDDYFLDNSFTFRYDYFLDNKNFLSYFIGTNFKIIPLNLNYKINFSYNFRTPSFNELYYFNYGNKNLLPEKSHSFSTGINSQLYFNNFPLLEYFDFDINFFIISTKDQISSVPKSPVEWIADNIAEVKNTGIELSFKSSHFNNFIQLAFHYTLQKPIDNSKASLNYNKNIPFIPEEIISSLLKINLHKDITIGTNAIYNSFMYSLSDNNPNSIIPNYFLFNVFFNYKLNFWKLNLELYLNCNNIFNKTNYHIPNYPLPRRNFRISILSNI